MKGASAIPDLQGDWCLVGSCVFAAFFCSEEFACPGTMRWCLAQLQWWRVLFSDWPLFRILASRNPPGGNGVQETCDGSTQQRFRDALANLLDEHATWPWPSARTAVLARLLEEHYTWFEFASAVGSHGTAYF